MADPVDPTQPPPPITASMHEPEINASTTGLPSNVAAALACIPLVGGIVFYILEKRDGFVRFYAMQSIVFGAAWFLFWIIYSIAFAILTPIPGIGFVFRLLFWAIWLVAGLSFLIIWIITMVKALSNVRWEIPYLGPLARKQFKDNAAV
jgi:uncharacterized membrane protein